MIVYVIGGIIGLVYGTIIAFLSGKLTENYIQKHKDEENPMKTSKRFSAARQLINVAALIVLCLFYKVLNQYLFPAILGTLIAMTLMSYFFLYRIGKKEHKNNDMES